MLAALSGTGQSNLKLLDGESTTSTNATVVLDGGAANDGAEEIDGAGSDSGGLGDAGLSAAKLATGLVEVCPHAALPLLAEMVVGELLEKNRSSVRVRVISRHLSIPVLLLSRLLPPRFRPLYLYRSVCV